MLVCTKNTALGSVSLDKYSTQLRLVLYLSLDMPPRVVFSIQTRGSALSNMWSILDALDMFLSRFDPSLELTYPENSISFWMNLHFDFLSCNP